MTGNEAAFPLAISNANGDTQWADGLTKREYFAAMALQGMLGNDVGLRYGKDTEALADLAIHYADALIVRLSKTESR